MKVFVIGSEERIRKFAPSMPVVSQADITVCPVGTSNEEMLKKAQGTRYLIADAICKVDREFISGLPDLKMIHSEGVGYNGIDAAYAAEKDIYVCNCKGCNAAAVAEQTVMLMLCLLRSMVPCHQAVLDGKQFAVKEYQMLNGIKELGEMQVGLYGFGSIGKETARRLKAFGCPVSYYQHHRLSEDDERELGVTYTSKEELIRNSDMLSLHVPVTEETRGMVNREFIQAMKDGAYLINTSRGELVVNEDLCEALESGKLSGAGLDTIAPEPVTIDNPLLNMSKQAMNRLELSPHIGGITTSTFKRSHRMIWENIERMERGERPERVVNGL